MKKTISVLVLLCLSMFLFTGCGNKNTEPDPVTPVVSPLYQLNTPKAGDTVVVIYTSKGTIAAVLYPEAAPKTVKNFINLCDSGYYDGVLLHKAIADFCIQMGDPTGKGDGGESYNGRGLENEFHDLLHNFTGALGMATGTDGLNHSQFYIVAGAPISDEYIAALKNGGYSQEVIDAYIELGGQPSLDYVYTVFGQVYEGLDIVKQISQVDTDKYNRPEKDIIIDSMYVYTYGEEY